MKLKNVSKAKVKASINKILDFAKDDKQCIKLLSYFLNRIKTDGYNPECFYDAIKKAGYYKAVERFIEQQSAKAFIEAYEDYSGNTSKAARAFMNTYEN